MTTDQTIVSQDLRISELFDAFYIVPNYQREYVWGELQVEQLLQDIHGEFTSGVNTENSEYFIGSIVVCTNNDGVLELIDGQQRMTTIYLFLCALRDHLKDRGWQSIDKLGPQISASDVDSNGNDIHLYRVDLQYEDSGDILNAIAQGTAQIDDVDSKTRSIANIRNAYRVLRAFMTSEFGDDDKALRRFYAFFVKNVKLIRIRTQSVAQALKIFETINDRGMGLDSMDLLKNLMFMHAKKQDFDKLKTKWKTMVDSLYKVKEKPLRFLRYFLISTYDIDRIKEEEVYGWFVKNEALCGYQEKPLSFVDELLAAARAYANYMQGKDHQGNANRHLENIRYMAGSARQHLILLLAARGMSAEPFRELCRHVESLFFAYIITRENTREFEQKFAQWAKEIRTIQTTEGVKAFVEQNIIPAKMSLSARFDLAFSEMTTESIQKYRMRYILGKLTQYVNEQGFGTTDDAVNLLTFINDKVDVEHILPQTLTEDVLAEFDSPQTAEVYIQRLGNLALVEKPLNTSLGNKPFSQKRPVYVTSKFLLTKSLGEKVTVGVNTSVDRAVKEIEPADKWSTAVILKRQDMLGRLARQTWEIPEPPAKETA